MPKNKSEAKNKQNDMLMVSLHHTFGNIFADVGAWHNNGLPFEPKQYEKDSSNVRLTH